MAVAYARASVRARVRLQAHAPLGAIVMASFALRALAAWFRATPAYFPDEYLYAALGRSFAASGQPLIRGHLAAFPALLQPILTAPAWFVGDVRIAYHLVQTIDAFLMSLAAVPAYWLARQLDLTRGVALAIAAVAVAIPDLLYTGWVTAEPVAYPLALAAFAAGTTALAEPTRRRQLAFVGLASLAVFARVQFVALPLCFVGAMLAVGLRERRLRPALREQALPLALFALPLLALAAGPSRVLGVYRGIFDFHLSAGGVAHWTAATAMVLFYASGWIVVPGALVGVALVLVRPRSRRELAFAALAALFTAALVVQAGFVASNGPEHVLERYGFYALPLAAIAFALWAARGCPAALPYAAVVAGLVALSARFPLGGYAAATDKVDSPFLFAVFRLEQLFGDVGNGSLALAVFAALLAGIALALLRRPRVAAAVGLGVAVAVCSLASLGAILLDIENTRGVRADHVAPDASWLDHARVGNVTLVATVGGERAPALEQLFWNRSATRVVLLPGARVVDQFAADRARFSETGQLVAGGRPLRGPFVVDHSAVLLHFRDAKRLGASPLYDFWRPRGDVRLASAFSGFYDDGWLAAGGDVRLWPATAGGEVSGHLTFRISAPKDRPFTLTFRPAGEPAQRFSVAAGGSRSVAVAVCSPGPWRATWSPSVRRFLVAGVSTRVVSARATMPTFWPDPAVCLTRSL